MRLTSLKIRNFRAIRDLTINDIGNAVVLAGPNGCGKSCILNAIRLLKSSYGSYEQDEYMQWMQESQIDLSKDASELHSIFQRTDQPIFISADFALSDEEKTYLKTNLRELLEKSFWSNAFHQPNPFQPRRRASLAAQQRNNRDILDSRLAELTPLISFAINSPVQHAALMIPPAGVVSVTDNHLLEFVFSTYDPQRLGVIDYHSPHRTYARVKLNSVNLTINADDQQQRQTALYGTKHGNVKSEMTAAYVRNLIAADADPGSKSDDLLTKTIRELFATFLPGKDFLGPVPAKDGSLLFPVQLSNGMKHDIDDLSSGEKEIVYGYLRLHSSAPKNSIIMIDEPELHLNPKLLAGLADFYYRHLGSRLNNQLWLVSHSDTLIREAVFNPSYAVYHIQPLAVLDVGPQAIQVRVKDDLDRLILDLVGDMASYRPGNKIVIFESTPEAAFDKAMVSALFPDFAQTVNFVSAGPKSKVTQLHDLLQRARDDGHLGSRFFSITDRDTDHQVGSETNRYSWDRYHIENYLLSPRHILKVLRASLLNHCPFEDEVEVHEALKKIAAELTPNLAAHEIATYVNSTLIAQMDIATDPHRKDTAQAIFEGLERTVLRISTVTGKELSLPRVSQMEARLTGEYDVALQNGQWVNLYRGRDVLKRFSGDYVRGMGYEFFRNAIIDKMVQEKYQPEGMSAVINAIHNS